MNSDIVILLVAMALSAFAAYLFGFRLPRQLIEVGGIRYRGILIGAVGSAFIFVGFLWLEILIVDYGTGLIGHGFSQDFLSMALLCVAVVAIGLGASWYTKAGIYASAVALLALPYLFVSGLDHGLAGISVGDAVILACILAFNIHYLAVTFGRSKTGP